MEHQQEMAYGETNGHVSVLADAVAWPWKV